MSSSSKTKKTKLEYICSQCNEVYPRWMGQCLSCKAWNCMEEFQAIATSSNSSFKKTAKIVTLEKSIETTSKINRNRLSSGIASIDRALGGGFVPGSLVLLGGEPGIGKSTLILEILRQTKNALYISGEESSVQISERARRIKVSENFDFLTETDLETILMTARKQKPRLVFVDSIQTIHGENTISGSISQVREAAAGFLKLAKSTGCIFFITGHINKEGNLAGPKALEHAVDVVLSFETHPHSEFRYLRAIKNRFGSTNELAIFEMSEIGLKEIQPMQLIAKDSTGGVGSIVFPQVEGSAIVPIEIQVLVTPTGYSNGRRIGENIDSSRIHLVAAVLDKFAGFQLFQSDLYVRILGSSLRENAGDLPLAIAMASSALETPLPPSLTAFGELSLTGSLRPAIREKDRIEFVKNWGSGRYIRSKVNQTIQSLIQAVFHKSKD